MLAAGGQPGDQGILYVAVLTELGVPADGEHLLALNCFLTAPMLNYAGLC